MRLSAVCACAAMLVLAFVAPASAGTVVTFTGTFEGQTEITAEWVAFKGGAFQIRELSGKRESMFLDETDVTRVDFGERAITLNENGALVLSDSPEDTAELWWAIDHRCFLVLLNTCRQDNKGTARPAKVWRLRRELEEKLNDENLSFERERDLRLAEVTILAATGQRLLVQRKLVDMDEVFKDDDVYMDFVLDMRVLYLEERRESGEVPKQSSPLPKARKGKGLRNDRPRP